MSRPDDMLIERLRAADPLPHDELDRLLRTGSAEELIGRAPARHSARRSRRVLSGAVTAAGLAAAAGVLVVALPRGEESAPVPGNIGILNRPATDADRLPDWVRGEQMVLEQGVDRDAARLARTTDARRYYVAPADGGRRVCLIDVPVTAPPLPPAVPGFSGGPGLRSGGIQCAGTEVFSRRFMVVMTAYGAVGRQLELVGVVPDGFERASTGDSTADIRENLVVLRPTRLGAAMRVSGPAGERTAYHGLPTGPLTSRIPRDMDLTVSVLQRAPRSADTPPPSLRATLDAARRRPGDPDPEPGTERRVATVGGTSYWLVRNRVGARTPRALLAVVSNGATTLRPIVLPTSAQPFRVFPSTLVREPYGPTRITLRTVVPDGFTSATVAGRTFPVRNNFLLIPGLPVEGGYSVELRGPAGLVVQSATLGNNEVRLQIPSNIIPLRETLIRERARRAGLREPLTATVVAGLREEIPRALGPWAATSPSSLGRTTSVVAVRGGKEVLVMVIESLAGPDPVVQQRRYRADAVPDLSSLGRVRPLDL